MGIIGFVFWVILIWKMGALKSTLPLGFRIKHGLFTFFFAGWNESLIMIGWMVLHPSEINRYYYLSIGYLPGWLNLTSKMVETVLGAAALFIGFTLIMWKEWARKAITYLVPFLAVVSPVEFLRGVTKAGPFSSNSELTTYIIAICVVSIAFHFWVYQFYNSKKVQTLFQARLKSQNKNKKLKSKNRQGRV